MRAARVETTVTTFTGLQDTAGKVQRLGWQRIVERLTQHEVGTREGTLFCGAEFKGKRRRENVVARHLYIQDVEANKLTGEIPPDIAEVKRAIEARGWAAVIYTTFNHTAQSPRYRVVLLPGAPIQFNGDVKAIEADGDITLGLGEMIGIGGVIDRTKLCAESMFFLPRHADGSPYEAVYIDGEPLDGSDLLEARTIGARLREDDATYTAAATEAPRNEDGVIGKYNASVSVAELLARYGYTRKPRSLVDWRSPYQQSESYATRVYDDRRFVTLSASDIAAGVGRQTRGGNAACGDAFDLYTAFEHKGDGRAAFRSAIKLLGLDAKKPAEDWDTAAASPDLDMGSESGAPKPALLRIRGSAAFAAEYEPASYLIDYMLQLGFLYSLTAETGGGKTALMLLISALVSTGKPFGDAEVKKGQVIYCVGENPDEFRQRLICLREASFAPAEYDGIHVLTPEAHKGLLTPAGTAEVAAYAEALGGVDLVVVDTAAAFFDGQEENSNTELGEYARRLRRLCSLPGKPTVVVCSHPTKNAAKHEELVPRGGGAFVAEVDGNLTLMKRDVGQSEMFWSKKFRGRIDNPVQIALTPVEAHTTRDAKGRPLRSVLASVTATTPVEAINAQKLRDRIMRIMADGKTRTVEEVALAALEMLPGQPARNDTPGYRKTGFQMDGLRKMRLLEKTDGRWRVTGGPAKQDQGDREDQF